MMTKTFHYPKSIRLIKVFGKVLSVAIPALLIILTIIGYTNQSGSYINLPGILITIVLFEVFFIYFIYYWSEIDLDNEGLWIEFLWFKLRVPWKEIIEIKKVPTVPRDMWLVSTSNLTVFHRLYGLINGPTLRAGFLINSKLEGYFELLQAIQQHNKHI